MPVRTEWEKTLRAWRKIVEKRSLARERIEVKKQAVVCRKGGVSQITNSRIV